MKLLDERIECFDFKDKFQEQHSDILKNLEYLEKTIKFLSTDFKEVTEDDKNSEKSSKSPETSPRSSTTSKSSKKSKKSEKEQTDLYKILGLILAIGNYLNGG